MTHDTLMALHDKAAEKEAERSYLEDQGTRNQMAYEYPALQLEAEEARAALSTAIADLIAERDAMTKDAERYRWLRDSNSDDARVMSYQEGLGEWLLYATPEDIDAAIDAAMKGTPT